MSLERDNQMAKTIAQLLLCGDQTVFNEFSRNLYVLNSNPMIRVWIEQIKNYIDTQQGSDLEEVIFTMLRNSINFSATCEEVVSSSDLSIDRFHPSASEYLGSYATEQFESEPTFYMGLATTEQFESDPTFYMGLATTEQFESDPSFSMDLATTESFPDAVDFTIRELKTCQEEDVHKMVTFDWIARIRAEASWLSDNDIALLDRTIELLIV